MNIQDARFLFIFYTGCNGVPHFNHLWAPKNTF